MSEISVLGRLRQEDTEFHISLDYIAILSQKAEGEKYPVSKGGGGGQREEGKELLVCVLYFLINEMPLIL
jgi:hypothetical protein